MKEYVIFIQIRLVQHILMILLPCYYMALKTCLHIWSCFYQKITKQKLSITSALQNSCSENLVKVFFCEFYKSFQNSFITEHLRTTSSEFHVQYEDLQGASKNHMAFKNLFDSLLLKTLKQLVWRLPLRWKNALDWKICSISILSEGFSPYKHVLAALFRK